MSYILDALQRADAERQRGAVPGLHDRPLPGQDGAAMADTSTRLWWLAAGVVALGALAAGLWVWRAPAHEASLARIAVPVASIPLSATQPAPAPMPLAPEALPPEPKPLPVATPDAAPPTITPTPAVAALRPAMSLSPTAATKALAKPNAPKPVAASSSAPQNPAATSSAISLLSELPETIRRQVPPLSITGAVYSENPTQRLLLVNNQVFSQGSQVAPEVTLEEIRQRSSVFSFHGTRFRVAH